jgi:anhydro-N-acetylmuramic acid kinase
MASGGEGAPLAPLGHFFLFNKRAFSQIILNLGGIANFTILPKNCKLEDVWGFDTGPCNVILDTLARTLFGEKFDRYGKIASSGRPNQSLLRELKKHKFFGLTPPKSTGREDFDETFIKGIVDSDLSPEDMIATASELTVWSIWDAYRRYVQPHHKIKQVIVSGGGVHNKYLLNRLCELFYPVEVITSDKAGYDPDAVEAIVFALLANQTINGVPGSLKKVTGSTKDTILGKICLP